MVKQKESNQIPIPKTGICKGYYSHASKLIPQIEQKLTSRELTGHTDSHWKLFKTLALQTTGLITSKEDHSHILFVNSALTLLACWNIFATFERTEEFNGFEQVLSSMKEDYIPVRLTDVGFLDQSGAEGVVTLQSLSDDREKLTMRGFSGEVSTHVARFIEGDRSSLPTIYNIVEDIAERSGLQLANVQIYGAGRVLRGDINFQGRDKSVVLQGYRASDCVALAAFYDAPILVQSSLLKNENEIA